MAGAVQASSSRGRPFGSLMRRFVVFYFGFALIPLGLLFFLFMRYDEGPYTIGVSRANLGVLILLVGTASLIGFLAMRATLMRVIRLAQSVSGPVRAADRGLIGELMQEEGEVAELAKSFNHIITSLERNIAELEETKETLHQVISKVGRALASMDDFNLLLQLVMETAAEALGAREGAVFSWNEEAGEFRLEARTPQNEGDAAALQARLQPHLDWMRSRGRILVEAPREGGGERAPFDPPIIFAPLNCHDRFWGAICLAGRHGERPFAPDEVKIVESLSFQIAITFENMHLSQDRERTYFETISALALAVEARDPYSRGHSDRVGVWATRIGAAMGLSAKEQQDLLDASRLHDIGKIGITDSILQKTGRLSDEEMEVMRRHTIIGEQIVAPLKSCQHLADPIRHHHERLDGSGYPDGLRGDAISLPARIIMVADVYDALTSARPYRGPMAWAEVKGEFLAMVAQGKMDKRVVANFIEVFESGAATIARELVATPPPAIAAS